MVLTVVQKQLSDDGMTQRVLLVIQCLTGAVCLGICYFQLVFSLDCRAEVGSAEVTCGTRIAIELLSFLMCAILMTHLSMTYQIGDHQPETTDSIAIKAINESRIPMLSMADN